MDEGVVACLDKNNKYNFSVYIRNSLDYCFEYFILTHPLEYLLEVTLGVKYIFRHGNMKECGWYNTYVKLFYDHEQKTPKSTNPNRVMGRRVAGLRNISTYPITINTFSVILNVSVAGLLGPKYMYSIIPTTITSFIATKRFVNQER